MPKVPNEPSNLFLCILAVTTSCVPSTLARGFPLLAVPIDWEVVASDVLPRLPVRCPRG